MAASLDAQLPDAQAPEARPDAPAGSAAAAVDGMPLMMGLRTAVDEAIARGDTPGAVVAWGHRGRYSIMAVGNRSLDPDVAMTEDTLFDLASVSKVVGTATSTMLLFEDGLLTPQMRVAERFPAFAQNGKEGVTVEDLLTHRSGLQAYDQPAKAEANRGGRTQADALLDHIASLKPVYDRGQRIEYSCLNFLTLARVNELTAGRSQQSLLAERVWGPLGMVNTTYRLTDEQRARVAPTFRPLPSTRTAGDVHDPLAYYHQSTDEHCSGNAGLYSDAHDLARYCQMILGEGEYVDGQGKAVRVLQADTVRTMTTLHAELPARRGDDTLRRGWGWMVFHDTPWTHPAAPTGSFFGHMGYTGTFIWLDKNSDVFAVVLTNGVYLQDPPESTPLRKAVVRAMNEAVYGPLPAVGPTPVAESSPAAQTGS